MSVHAPTAKRQGRRCGDAAKENSVSSSRRSATQAR